MREQTQGKYCDFYWSVKKQEKGFVWKIRAVFGGEVIESSLDNEDDDDKYLPTLTAARSEAYDAIQNHYT